MPCPFLTLQQLKPGAPELASLAAALEHGVVLVVSHTLGERQGLMVGVVRSTWAAGFW